MGRPIMQRILICLALGWLCSAAAAATVRFAVLSEDPSCDALADVLMVELTRGNRIELLDRSRLQAVLDERTLGALSPRERIQRARLAGADALLLLAPLVQTTNGLTVVSRLVSASQGAVLGWWTDHVLPEDSVVWARNSAGKAAALAQKAGRPPEALARLSFVGFRSTASTPGGTTEAALLNALLLARLGAEPDLLVLERRRLLDAAFEKVLNDDDRAFWSGAHLVEGTINRDGITDGRVTLHVRLVRSGGATTDEATVSGSTARLAEVADAFVAEVRRMLDKSASDRVWDPAVEAARFRDEARAAIQFQRWDDARAASDTAFGLGLRGRVGLVDRIRAYSGSTREPALDLHRSWHTPRNDYGVLMQYGPVPGLDTVAHALETARLLRELCDLPEGGLADGPSRQAIRSALDDLGRLLMRFYFAAESRAGLEADLAELRRILRETMDRVLETAEMRQHCFMTEPIAVTFTDELTDAEKETVALFEHLRRYGPMFCETPEAGVQLHGRLMASPRYGSPDPGPRARALEEEDPLDLGVLEWLPPIFGWTWQARQRCEPVWAAFEGDFERVVSASRRLGAIHEVPNDAGYAGALESLIRHFETNRLEQLGIQAGLEGAFLRAWLLERGIIASNIVVELETNQIARLRAVLAGIDRTSPRDGAKMDLRIWPARWARTLERFEHSERTGQVPTPGFIARWLMADESGSLTQAKAERWQTVLARLRDMASAAGDRRAVQLLRPGGNLAWELMRLQMVEPSPSVRTASSNRLAGLAVPELPEATRRLRVFDLPTGLHFAKVSGTLALERIPVGPLGRAAAVEQAVWRDGIFWLLSFSDSWEPAHSLASLDPSTGRLEAFPVPASLVSPAEFSPHRNVVAGREHVLLFLKRTAVRLDRRTRRMTAVALPIEPAKVFRQGDRIFLWSRDTLLETTETLNDFKVLASLRRRPALGPLDELPSLTDFRLCAAGTNNVAVVLGKRIFPLDGTAGEWPVAPGLRLDVAESPDGSLLHEASFGWPNYDPMRGSGKVTGPGVHRIWRLGASPPDREPVWTSESIPPAGRALLESHNTGGQYRLFGEHGTVLPFGGGLVSVPKHGESFQITVMPADAWHPLLFDTTIKGFLEVGFVQGPQEILFFASQPMSGQSTNFLFLLRQAELETHLARARQAELDQEAESRAMTDRILAAHDVNRNGLLDEAELPCLATEPEALNLAWWLCDSNRWGRLQRSDLHRFDFDRDREFDAAETAAFHNATAYLARVRYLQVATADQTSVPLTNIAWVLMEQGDAGSKWDRSRHDLDRDGAISWPEFLAAMMEQQHRNLLAEAAAISGRRFVDLEAEAPEATSFLEPGFLSYIMKIRGRRPDLLSLP